MIEKAASLRYDACMAMRGKALQTLVEKTVKETLRAELAHERAKALPAVSKEEQKDIAARYKQPTGRTARTLRVRWSGK